MINRVPQLFDLDAVLRNNDVLSDAAQDEAKALLLNAEHHIKRLDRAIIPVGNHSALKSHRAERMRVIQSIQSFRMVIAPHRKLPPEILAEVFRYCINPEIRVGSRPFTVPLDFVCSKWRQVALGTPDLWSKLYIDYGDWSDYFILTKEAKLRLSRSGNALLSLTITASRHPASFNAISDLVMPCASRLRFLSVKSTIQWLTQFLQLPPMSVEHLQSVELAFLGHGDCPFPPDSPTCIASRRLRSVVLEAPSHNSSIKFPWLQLTNLCLYTSLTPTTALAILRQCLHLQHCTLLLGNSGSSVKTDSRVILSDLQSLVVHLSPVSLAIPYHRLLRQLVLPKIATFKLLKGSRYAWRPLLQSAVVHSRTVRTLELSVQVSSVDIEGMLRDTPLLVTLSLPAGEPFMKSTMDMISRGELVPRLENLKCITNSMGLFLNMIESRRVSGGGSTCSVMKSVSVVMRSHDFTRDCRARVDSLIAGGLEMVFLRRPLR